MSLLIKSSHPCVIIEGPNWSEAPRVCAWMEEAGLLNRSLQNRDWPIEHHDVFSLVDFANAAISLVSMVHNRLVLMSTRWGLGCEFALLVKLGFFELDSGRYRFALPKCSPYDDRVAEAVIELCDTDNGQGLRPEKMIVTQPFRQALKGPWKLQNTMSPHPMVKPQNTISPDPMMLILEECDQTWDA
jgi:hypothetical protein